MISIIRPIFNELSSVVSVPKVVNQDEVTVYPKEPVPLAKLFELPDKLVPETAVDSAQCQ